MMKKLVVTAVLAGVVGTPGVSYAATAAPTLAGPAVRVGYGPVELTGTAGPGATVQLYETAIVFDDLEPADDWANGGGPVTATADSSGHWHLQRTLDSGFYFQVVSDGARSNKLTVRIQQSPVLTLASTSANTVTAHVEASPGEPTLAAQVQINLSGTWTTILAGTIGDGGAFEGAARNAPAGPRAFRAYVGADPANGVLAGYSAERDLTVLGAPAPSKPTPTGSVQFTKVQYRAKSLDNEWVLVTNKTAATVDLRAWTIRDAANHVYTLSGRLNRGASLYLHTGKGVDSAAHRYWGRAGYIWNDGGDTAILRDAKGKTVDSCRWGPGGGMTNC